MKSKVLSFLSGVLFTLVLVGMPATALAAGNGFTIECYPIKVLINGEVFQPKDAKGNDALVFTFNGTTYAPLRALAEAYGLEVGYDDSRNLAAVNRPKNQSTAESSAFKPVWTVKEKPVTNYGSEKIFTAAYNGDLSMDEFKVWWKSLSAEEISGGAEQLADEAQRMNPGYTVTMYFSYGQYNLGTAYGFEGYQQSNFKAAGVWIK